MFIHENLFLATVYPQCRCLLKQKSQKYGAFFNKKLNFKTDDSLSILSAQMVESKKQTFNLTRTQFEDSLELENSKKFFNSKTRTEFSPKR